MTCTCGTETPVGAKFCPNCGHLLTSAEERRVVTVLFADLVGFTKFSETLDPERAKHIVDRYFERLVADITSFGGKIDKIIGDGILALFGAPTAHEDDAERAVRAGLRMQRTVQSLSDELDLEMQLRIGVSTGEVLVGASQARSDYTAMGDTVNLASRLEELATPTEVWVGPATYAATNEAIQYESRGTVEVRGRNAEVAIHVAMHELTLPGRRPRTTRAPLVGRDTEMSVLRSALTDSAERGHGYLMQILGDAGMGKSRIVEELVLGVEQDFGALVLEGRCLPYGETSPWWPLGEALRELFQIEAGDHHDQTIQRVTAFVSAVANEDDVERVSQGLLYLMGHEVLVELDSTRAAQEATWALQSFLAAHAKERFVMLVIYDLHWADSFLLELLERVLVALRPTPFTMLTTTRWNADEERWIPNAGRHNSVVQNLTPLSVEAAGRLAAELLGSDVSDDLAEYLYKRSGGNPFFLEELILLMNESNAVVPGTQLDATGPIQQLPDTLRGLVAARLDGLSAAERSMVDEASVIGRDGPIYALLLTVETLGFEDGEQIFDQLATKDIFETDGQGWRFRSDLVREVAYATITKTVRIQRHSSIANWLEHRGDIETMRLRDLARISYHYSAASKLAREFTELPKDVPSDLLERTLVSLERAGSLAQRIDSNFSAGKSFHRLIALTPVDQPVRLSSAYLGRASARLRLREMPGASEDASRALQLAVEAANPALEAKVLVLLAEISFFEGNEIAARTQIDLAMKLATDLGDEALLADALRQSGFIYLRRDAHTEAEADLTRALAIFRRRGDKAGEGWCMQNLAWLAFEHGEVQEAERRLRSAIDLFESVGDVGGLGWARGLLAHLRFFQGETHEAEVLALSVVDEVRDRGDTWGYGMISILLASISLWSGRTQESTKRAATTLAHFERIDDVQGQVQALCVLGRSQMACGLLVEARRTLERAIELAASTSAASPLRLANVVALGAAVQSGDLEWSEELLAVDLTQLGSEAFVADRAVTEALANLQHGRFESIDSLSERSSALGDLGSETNLRSCVSLMYAMRGDSLEAIEHGRPVIDNENATYLDRRTAYIAIGLAYARLQDRDSARKTFDDAITMIDATQSHLSQAVVRLAQATALQRLETDDAMALSSEAERRLYGLSATAEGWRNVFNAAVGREPLLTS